MSIEEASASTTANNKLELLPPAEGEMAPSGIGHTARLKRLGHNILKFAGVGIAAAILPSAASFSALELAPPVAIGAPIAGAEVNAQLEPGTNAENINFHLASLHRTSPVSVGPLHLGANVTFNYDKVSLDSADGDLDIQKVEPIIKDFSDTKDIQDRVVAALKEHYAIYCGASFGAAALAEAGLLTYFKHRRKQLEESPDNIKDVIARDRKLPRTIGLTAVVLAAGGLLVAPSEAAINGNHDVTIHPDKALASAGLNSFSITGPGRAIVDTLVTQVNNLFQQEDRFYSAERANFTTNFEAKYGTGALAKVPGTKRIIFADDFQGQSGPASVVGLAAKEYNADLIVIGGDTTASGLPQETFELDELRHYAGSAIPALISRGHHDPTAPQMQQMVKSYKNYYIADGRIHKIGGLDIAGFNAPDIIPYASDTSHLIKPSFPGETITQASQKLTAKAINLACSSDKPVITEMHDQLIGTPLAQANCTNLPLVLTGREYYPQPPRQYPVTTEFISGSTGAHTPNETFGSFTIITKPATFTEVTINAKTYRVISANRITLSGEPETNVTIREITPSTKIEPIITEPSNS